MLGRSTKVLATSVMLFVLVGSRPALCEGWSILNPFSSSSDSKKEEAKKPAFKSAAKKDPSTLDKMGQGTKNFFNKTGETLGLKKPEPKKPLYATAKQPTLQTKKKESKSWFDKTFGPSESEKPKDVHEWMKAGKRMDP